MNSETLYQIVQTIRTLLPVFAAIGTISSAVGFWKIFNKWGKPGVLSLLPFARGWIFGKDSETIPRSLYAISDGLIVVLTPIFYYIRANGKVEEVMIAGHLFYIDKAMLVVTVVWAICEGIRFLSSVHISANLCKKNERGKGWTISWVLMPKISKIIWGFSDQYIKNELKEEN